MTDAAGRDQQANAPSRHDVRRPIVIAPADLASVAELAAARLADPVAERERLTLLEGVFRAGAALYHALSQYSLHALSESRGSHSRWDLSTDAMMLQDALCAYAEAVRRAAVRAAAWIDIYE